MVGCCGQPDGPVGGAAVQVGADVGAPCPVLYDLLALTDALRVGKPRVQAVAAQMLADRMAVDVKPAEPLLQWGHAVVSFGYPALGSTPSSQTGRADPEDVFLGFA